MDFPNLDDIVSLESNSNMTPMDNTLLSLDDFPSKESTSNMTPPMDCLRSGLKSNYGEEGNLINEQLRIKKEERVTQSPQVLDHQEKPIPRKKQSKVPRKVTKQSMIKKAAENNSEDQQHTSDDDRGIRKRSRQVARDNQERKKMKRNIPVRAQVPAPVGELDNEFKNLITSKGGSLESLKLVIQKKLFESDVKPEEGRLSIPQKKMISRFLEKEEDEYLDKRNGDKMNEKRVMLIDPSRQESHIKLRKWSMKKANGKGSWSYVLVKGWNEVVKKNALTEDTEVQLWAFRKGTELCFALVRL